MSDRSVIVTVDRQKNTATRSPAYSFEELPAAIADQSKKWYRLWNKEGVTRMPYGRKVKVGGHRISRYLSYIEAATVVDEDFRPPPPVVLDPDQVTVTIDTRRSGCWWA
jgi:hypothetical protein